MVFFSNLGAEFGLRIDRRIDLPAEGILGVMETRDDIGEGNVTGDQQINVAAAFFHARGDRAIDERTLDSVLERIERAAECVGGADGLRDQALELREEGRARVGLEIDLPAADGASNEAGFGEEPEFSLDGPQAEADETCDLAEVERFVGTAEQQGEHGAAGFPEEDADRTGFAHKRTHY